MADWDVVDVHAHVGRNVAMDVSHSAAEYLETMDRAQIARALLSPMAGGRQAEGVRDTMRENDAIAEAVRRDPSRFPVGLASIEVRHEEHALAELERCFDALGLRGLVFHAIFSGFTVGEGKVLDPLLDLANQRAALCLMHALPEAGAFSMESPRAIGELAARYPDVIFIMGHPAITPDQRAVSVEAAIGRDNVFVDLAYQASTETVETLVRTLGPERILFGSDSPFCDPQPVVDSVLAARISDTAKERMLGGNADELLRRYS